MKEELLMKKNFKKLLALTLVFIMVLIPVQVSAKTLIPERVIYLPVHTGVVENIGFYPPDKKAQDHPVKQKNWNNKKKC